MKGKSYVMILLINGRRVRRVLGDINEEEVLKTLKKLKNGSVA